jgi:hypothetical protein
MNLNDYVDGEEEFEVNYEPYGEEEVPEEDGAHGHVDGELDLDLTQMNCTRMGWQTMGQMQNRQLQLSQFQSQLSNLGRRYWISP